MTTPTVRRFQFRLSALLLLMSGLGLWLGWQVSELHQKQQAVSVIEAVGGTVTYDYQWNTDHSWNPDAVPPGPAWLRQMLGDNYQANVVEIQLFAGSRQRPLRFTDADAKHLGVLHELKWLVLQDTNLTDQGLLHLRSLTKLERLDIEGTHVTEAGVRK